jgi:hypothetical protein
MHSGVTSSTSSWIKGNPDKRSFMSDYQYKIGQKVFLRTAAHLGAPHGAYQILERLRAQNDRLRYLIGSLEHEGYRQIVDECDLGRL